MAYGLLIQTATGLVALIALVKGAEKVVDRSIAIAQYFDVPDILIAMTAISIGTSLPEIISGIMASLGMQAGGLDPVIGASTVIGGNIGSSMVQFTLLLGIAAIGFGGIQLSRAFLAASYIPMVLASGVLILLAWDGVIARTDALVMLFAYLAYTYHSYRTRERNGIKGEDKSTDLRRDLLIVAGALLLVIVSSAIILGSAEKLVSRLGLGGSMVGMVTLGLAAALPELSTVMEGIRRNSPGIAVGTLVGSNIVNPLLGLGLATIIHPYVVPAAVTLWDLPFKIVVSLALLFQLVYVSDMNLRRRDGVYLIIAFFIFIAVRMLFFAAY